MARQPTEDLTLGAGLIRKGEARGLSPTMAEASPEPTPPSVAAPPSSPLAAAQVRPEPPQAAPMPDIVEDEPPLRAAPPDDVPKRFTSFRLPVELDEELRAMMFETRRSKQDLLIEFVTEGVKVWRRNRARRS